MPEGGSGAPSCPDSKGAGCSCGLICSLSGPSCGDGSVSGVSWGLLEASCSPSARSGGAWEAPGFNPGFPVKAVDGVFDGGVRVQADGSIGQCIRGSGSDTQYQRGGSGVPQKTEAGKTRKDSPLW